MKEVVWKDIPDFEGLYQINNFGEVKSLERVINSGKDLKIPRYQPEKLMKPSQATNGYWQVILCKNGKYKSLRIHRLLGLLFIPNPNPKEFKIINHINNIRTDNRLENLEWCSHQLNNLYYYTQTINKKKGVSYCKKYKKWVAEIRYMYKKIKLGYFDNKEEAYQKYYEKHIELHGFVPWK